MKLIKKMAIAAVLLFGAQESHAAIVPGEARFRSTGTQSGILNCGGVGICANIVGPYIYFEWEGQTYQGVIIGSVVPAPEEKEFELEDVQEVEGDPE